MFNVYAVHIQRYKHLIKLNVYAVDSLRHNHSTSGWLRR